MAPQKKSPAPASPARSALARYHHDSRQLLTSLVLVVPLFLFYQLGVLWTGGIRNGVDFMTDVLWQASGASLTNYLLVNVGVVAALLVAIFALRKREAFRPRIWPWVVAESSVYAFFFGAAVVQVMDVLGLSGLLATGAGAAAGAATDGLVNIFVLSIGAGLYEELVFRLLLMGGMFAAAVRLLDWPRWLAAVCAVLASSLAFSAVHHLGNMGEAFVLGTFMFRFIAGILLASIFYLRGFAVAVYTHAIYDVFVLLLR